MENFRIVMVKPALLLVIYQNVQMQHFTAKLLQQIMLLTTMDFFVLRHVLTKLNAQIQFQTSVLLQLLGKLEQTTWELLVELHVPHLEIAMIKLLLFVKLQ
jgi:hypothetical protein